MAAPFQAPSQPLAEEMLGSFQREVNFIEQRDAQWTSDTQIERLLKKGTKYLNLNPFGETWIVSSGGPL